ncbi:MAG: carboxylesterase/lipase family protein [Promethearchaeota archaeon]
MNKTQIIETKTGKIQGIAEDDLETFKGIPYAEPPIGDLRFLEPVAKRPWEGVLDAIKYGACAYQGYTQLEEWLGKPAPESEDCLLLNIWTPATDDKKRPVMFWIHGGACITGTGNEPMYDGSALAKRGDIVVVTINYRLGSFGFLHFPGELINVGSLDQIAALKWLNENIEKFGGDPSNVTIFGESAGGYSVLALCAMPAAKGLFKRVIGQSAPTIDPAINDKTTKKIMRKLGFRKGTVQDLKDIPPEKIIDVQNKIFESDPTNIMALRPMIDGKTFSKHPLKAFEDGDCSEIDLMLGTNMDEFKLFTAMDALKEIIKSDALKLLIGFLGMAGIPADKTKEIIDIYAKAREGKYSTEPMEIFNALINDYAFRIQTIRLLVAQHAHNTNTYNYLFDWKSPGLDGALGACHALELPFVFGTLDVPTMKEFVKGAPKDLSEKMMDAWISFAKTGNPNHANLPEWPAYDASNRATMILGTEPKVANNLFEEERKAWEGVLNL